MVSRARPVGPWLRRALLGGLLLAASLALWAWSGWGAGAGAAQPPSRLLLVLPDDAADENAHVMAWRDAAAELGFPLELVRASQLLRRDDPLPGAALILPDTIHRRMNDALVARLDQWVRSGMRLMLVFDAGATDMAGRYHPQQSRLSKLAGVRYGLYGELRAGMLIEQAAWVDQPALATLALPPGKLMRQASELPLTSAQPAPGPDEQLAVVSYHYGRLRYPMFATAGGYDGQRLMHGDGQHLVAGVRALGRGEVLFVNLPLSYLKLRTDGLLLHTFLQLFARDRVGLPQLSTMPDARGALVMNWHIDSAAAVPAMQRLAELGAFEQGPYSVHLTAGPDVDTPGDGLGMDLPRNPVMQQWVQRFASRGDEVGSHGGWIHNEFGRLVSSQDHSLSSQMIERNTQAVSDASGKPVIEYSAPTGNHPAWVTPWLALRGVRAYYFTGDIGMAPTRSYQDGVRGPANMWAFPVLSFGRQAAFEEAAASQVPEADIAAWLRDVADYCADRQTLRLMYFHPPGIALFPQAFKQWMAHTRALVDQGRLRWITMAQYAAFANRRLQVVWSLQDGPQGQQLAASHPDSLAHLAWLLPATRYAQPRLLEGEARIVRAGGFWQVHAGAGPRLLLDLPPAPVAAAANKPTATEMPAPTHPRPTPAAAPVAGPDALRLQAAPAPARS